jgi:hypothetical protein
LYFPAVCRETGISIHVLHDELLKTPMHYLIIYHLVLSLTCI